MPRAGETIESEEGGGRAAQSGFIVFTDTHKQNVNEHIRQEHNRKKCGVTAASERKTD